MFSNAMTNNFFQRGVEQIRGVRGERRQPVEHLQFGEEEAPGVREGERDGFDFESFFFISQFSFDNSRRFFICPEGFTRTRTFTFSVLILECRRFSKVWFH